MNAEETIPEVVLTKKIFTEMVETRVHTDSLSYIEAVLHICEDRGIDPSDIGRLVGPVIRSKLEAEGMQANLLPKSSSISKFM